MPTEELLDDEEEAIASKHNKETKILRHDNNNNNGLTNNFDIRHTERTILEENMNEIREKLEEWCKNRGFKDCSVNMLTLSRSIGVSKDDLTQYFDKHLNSTFRIWLSDIRFNAVKKMMKEYPDYSNDIISIECGFSSRTSLYRIFKIRENCTPAAWREKYIGTNL